MPRVYSRTDKLRSRQQRVEPKSSWPLAVRDLFCTLNDIPWAVLALASTLFGLAVLASYVEPFYPLLGDPGPLVTFAGLASLASVLVITSFTLAFFGPSLMAGVYNTTTGLAQSLPMDGWRFYFFQLWVIGLGLLSVFWGRWNTWSNGELLGFWSGAVLVLGAVFFLLCGLFHAWLRDSPGDGGMFAMTAAMSGIFAAMPCVVYIQMAKAFDGALATFAVAVLALAMPLVNIGLVATKKLVGSALFAVALVIVFCMTSTLVDRKLGFATFVARTMHVQSVKPLTLVIQNDACKTLHETLIAKGLTTPPFSCYNNVPIAITVRVVWNMGARWILEFPVDDTGKSKPIYAVLPADTVRGM